VLSRILAASWQIMVSLELPCLLPAPERRRVCKGWPELSVSCTHFRLIAYIACILKITLCMVTRSQGATARWCVAGMGQLPQGGQAAAQVLQVQCVQRDQGSESSQEFLHKGRTAKIYTRVYICAYHPSYSGHSVSLYVAECISSS